MPLKLSVHSDLHLELRSEEEVSEIIDNIKNLNCDVIILAGDIGNPYHASYEQFLTACSKKVKYVILITGNHEYYNNNIDETDDHIRELIKQWTNVFFLQRETMAIGDCLFLGCTLWSKADKRFFYKINDFTQINGLNIDKYVDLFDTNEQWLVDEITSTNNRLKYNNIIVITHHLPSYQLINEIYRTNFLNSYFASDLNYLLSRVNYWMCGHTHKSFKGIVKNCYCVINPLGYTHENSDYDPNLIIEIKEKEDDDDIDIDDL